MKDREAQIKFADQVIGALISRAWKDESTDPTGFTITKRKLGEHAGKVMEIVKRGGFDELPEDKRIKF